MHTVSGRDGEAYAHRQKGNNSNAVKITRDELKCHSCEMTRDDQFEVP